MGRKKLRKYDVAISFTEKDRAVAHAIAKALKKKCAHVYFYPQENQLAEDLKEITLRQYGNRSNYGLVILSPEYKQKKWPRKEWQTLVKSLKDRKIKKIFVVQVEKAYLPGLSTSVIYAKWKNNPREIADQISEQMRYKPNCLLQKMTRIVLILLFTSGVFYAFNLFYQHYSSR